MDKLKLTGRNLDRVFHSRLGHICIGIAIAHITKQPNLKSKTHIPKQLLGSLPLAFALPGQVLPSVTLFMADSLPLQESNGVSGTKSSLKKSSMKQSSENPILPVSAPVTSSVTSSVQKRPDDELDEFVTTLKTQVRIISSQCRKIGFLPDGLMHVRLRCAAPIYVRS